MKYSLFLFLFSVLFSCQSPESIKPLDVLKNGKWIDLSYDFDENTIYWPTNVSFSHDTVFYGLTDKGFFYSSGSYAADEHGGTHLDAPIHFSANKNSVERIKVDQLTGEGILIDISKKALKDSDYLVSLEDFKTWEQANGKIPEGAVVLLFTGYGQFWNVREKYLGTTLTGAEAVPDLHFPGLHPDAAKWLVSERNIKGIGLDTPSIDYGQSQDFLAHQVLCEKEILIFENVANLDKVPANDFYVVALPMKIKGGTGAPLRIIAYLPF